MNKHQILLFLLTSFLFIIFLVPQQSELTVMADYVDDKQIESDAYDCVIDSTRKIRRRSAKHCGIGYEQCHIAGLNMIKQFLNAERWSTRSSTCDVVIKKIRQYFNAEDNFICCPYEKNRVIDIDDEIYLILALRGKMANNYRLNENQKKMLIQFQRLLKAIQTDLDRSVGRSKALDAILGKIRYYLMLHPVVLDE